METLANHHIIDYTFTSLQPSGSSVKILACSSKNWRVLSTSHCHLSSRGSLVSAPSKHFQEGNSSNSCPPGRIQDSRTYRFGAPIGSMYGIYTYIYYKKSNHPCKYIYQSHGSYGVRLANLPADENQQSRKALEIKIATGGCQGGVVKMLRLSISEVVTQPLF